MAWIVDIDKATLYSQPHYRSITVGFVSKQGSWSDKKRGSSLFLANLMSRAAKKFDEEAVAEAINGNGASLVYRVARDQIFLGVRMPIGKVEKILPVLANLVKQPSFRKRIVRSEQQLLIEDAKRRDSQPSSRHRYDLVNNAFRHTALSNAVLGEVSEVRSIITKDLEQRQRELFKEQVWLPIVVGPEEIINQDRIKQWFEELMHLQFDTLSKQDPLPSQSPRPLPFNLIPNKLAKQGYYSIAILGPSEQDLPTLTNFLIAGTILGGDTDSPLYRLLREEKGLCYYAGANIQSFAPYSLLTLDAVSSPKNGNILVEEMFKILIGFVDSSVEIGDFEAHKSMLITKLHSASETTRGMAQFIAARIRKSGEQRIPQDIIEKTEKTTLEEVRKTMKAFLTRQRVSMTVTLQNAKQKDELQTATLMALSTMR